MSNAPRPTKAQTWGGVTIISGIVATLVAGFIFWVSAKTLKVDVIVETMIHISEALDKQALTMERMALNDREARADNTKGHSQIKAEIAGLRFEAQMHEHKIREATTICDAHIQDGHDDHHRDFIHKEIGNGIHK